MKLKALQTLFHKTLDAIYDPQEVNSFFYLMLDHYLGVSKIQLALDTELTIEDHDLRKLQDGLHRLSLEEPIQYILGETQFYNLPIYLNPFTLIPRPETEELVSWILKDTNPDKKINILDIGTGSGCIAIALAKHLPNATVYGIDISPEALNMSQKNAQLNSVEVHFELADIFGLNLPPYDPIDKFDLIVSNPPYVRRSEASNMMNNVLRFEPDSALFVEDDSPLKYYKAIMEFAHTNLVDNGFIYFEINEYLGEEMKALLESNNYREIILRKDIFSKDRMIKAKQFYGN